MAARAGLSRGMLPVGTSWLGRSRACNQRTNPPCSIAPTITTVCLLHCRAFTLGSSYIAE